MKPVYIMTRTLTKAILVGATAVQVATVHVAAAAAPPPGCARLQHAGAESDQQVNVTQSFSLMSSNRNRTYSIHLPPGYNATSTTPYPVVLGFHGSQEPAIIFEWDTQFSEIATGKIMVYPEGVGLTWAGASYSNVSVGEDLQFVSDLVAELREKYCVDDDRIYATGFSNGAGFVNAIACNETVGAQFAAFAPHTGAYYDATDEPCSIGLAMRPMISFHGGNDKTVPYEGGGGEGGTLPRIEDWLEEWVMRDNCTAESKDVVDSFGGKVHHSSWDCQGVKGVLQHYKVDDMGHVWASTEPNLSQLSTGEGPTHIDASSIIMKFFDNFTKPMTEVGTGSPPPPSNTASPGGTSLAAPTMVPANLLFSLSNVIVMTIFFWV
ncbi:carbohydrate esterase family 1 protein [Naviculisporaceae sp. PSN 640]